MPNFGPTGYNFELDAYNPADNTVAAAQELPRITEFNGINEEGMVTDLTAFGDTIKSEGPIGVSQFERIQLRGYADDAAGSAFRRIGRPARRADYPARTLTVTHRSGVTQAIEVFPVINRLVPTTEDLTMFEATLAIASKADSDFVESGF